MGSGSVLSQTIAFPGLIWQGTDDSTGRNDGSHVVSLQNFANLDEATEMVID